MKKISSKNVSSIRLVWKSIRLLILAKIVHSFLSSATGQPQMDMSPLPKVPNVPTDLAVGHGHLRASGRILSYALRRRHSPDGSFCIYDIYIYMYMCINLYTSSPRTFNTDVVHTQGIKEVSCMGFYRNARIFSSIYLRLGRWMRKAAGRCTANDALTDSRSAGLGKQALFPPRSPALDRCTPTL